MRSYIGSVKLYHPKDWRGMSERHWDLNLVMGADGYRSCFKGLTAITINVRELELRIDNVPR